MSEDTKLKQLIINTLSPEQMPSELSPDEIYLVEDDAEYASIDELTLAEYNSIEHDPKQYYAITDDEPLVIADFTTLVNQVASQLAKKVDLPDNKGQDSIDYVVEWKRPTESDPTWYRVYKSGWVEQGGMLPRSGKSGQRTINLQKRMIDINYNVYVSMATLYTSDWTGNISAGPSTVSSIIINSRTNEDKVYWQVSGQGE